MAEHKDMMTNEALMSDRFCSQFDLVNYAIGVAQDMVKSGRPARVQTEIQNPAYQTLQEITQGKDLLPPAPVLEEEFDGDAEQAEIESQAAPEKEEEAAV